jgi:ribosomal protein L9
MRMETEMSEKAVIGVYDSLSKAEAAELLLGDVHLPVGQEFLVAADMEAGKVHGNITAREVANALADTGVPLAKEDITGYEQALKAGKLLLIFHGDEGMVTKAYDALGNTDHEELTVLGG